MRYRVAIFLGAFLLFGVQPLIGRAILPLFGGGAGVWLACMLFFQLVLLLGYAYAHGLMAGRSAQAGARIHGGLLLFAAATLAWPVILGRVPWLPSLNSPGAGIPVTGLAILVVLAGVAAFPLVALSATSPLVQAAYARGGGRDPFRLYATSNWGSMAGLLAYPLLIEPWVDLSVQAYGLTALFLIHGGLVLNLLWTLPGGRIPEEPAVEVHMAPDAPPDAGAWLRWVGLAGLGTLWLMAVSQKLSTDVASMPLIWVLPLGVYLLTYILAFEGRWSVSTPAWRGAMGLILLVFALSQSVATLVPSLGALLAKVWGGAPAAAVTLLKALQPGAFLGSAMGLAALFAGGILAHGRLAELRPAPSGLTRFYLWISIGGCLGGLIASLVAPLLFNQIYELPLVVLGSFLILLWGYRSATGRGRHLVELALAAGGVALVLLRLSSMAVDRQDHFARDFFGSVEVKEPHPSLRTLMHGTTAHGMQFIRNPLRPASYFGETSAIGRVLRSRQATAPRLRVGIVGLGVGNVAAFGRAGDAFTFFEISPKVIRLAGPQGTAFDILRSTPATVDVVQGDGRIALEAYRGEPFDVLLIDAFAGGHIPTHLLTREALRGYLRTLKPDGLLVLHVSHHLPLPRQAGANLRDAGLYGLYMTSGYVLGRGSDGSSIFVESFSQYWVAGRRADLVFRPEFLEAAHAAIGPGDLGASPDPIPALGERGDRLVSGLRPWTDERNSLTTLLLKR
jgi:SAM-dependent methyltransferase